MDLQSLGVYVYLSLWGCACVHVGVCMSMSVLLLVKGRMQPSRTLLLKLKRDPDIIFAQYLWISEARAKSKNLICRAIEEWNLKPLQGRWIGKKHSVVWAPTFIWVLFDCNVNSYQAENVPACPQSLCFAKAKSLVHSFCSNSRLCFVVTHQGKSWHDDDDFDHHFSKTQLLLYTRY